MNKFVIPFIISLLISAGTAAGQDYYVTWQDDTVHCRFPSNPKKEGISHPGRYLNGHVQLAAIVNNEVRILKPADIRQYSRSKHGKSFLCNGTFYSYGADFMRDWTSSRRGQDTLRYFMNELVKGEKAGLLITYTWGGSSMFKAYYLKLPGKPKTIYLQSKKHLASILYPEKSWSELKHLYKRSRSRAFPVMIENYNKE